MVSVGDPARPFTLPDQNFSNVSPIEQGAGKVVVLNFFPAAFSGGPETGCECQMKTLDEELDRLKEGGAVVVGISRELPFTMAAWVKKLGLRFPLLSDPNLAVSESYVGTTDLGKLLETKTGIRALGGYMAPNRGVVVIGLDGRVAYKWVAKDASGRPHPGTLPDIEQIKQAVQQAQRGSGSHL